jgi:hypothetical protein
MLRQCYLEISPGASPAGSLSKGDAAPAGPCQPLSVAASRRHQTRWGPSPATGRLYGRRYGQWHKRGGADDRDPTLEPPSRVPGRAWTLYCPTKKVPSLFTYVSQGTIWRSKSRRRSLFHDSSRFLVVFLFLPFVWLFLVAVRFFNMFGD